MGRTMGRLFERSGAEPHNICILFDTSTFDLFRVLVNLQSMNDALVPAAQATIADMAEAQKTASYINDVEEGRRLYGVDGEGCCDSSRLHNEAYATGFRWMQTIMLTIFMPLSVPFAFVIGLMVA